MKKLIIIVVGLLVVLLVMGITLLWLRRGPATTRFELAGVAGSPFTGCYVRDGQRIAVSGVLPWSFHGIGISEFEFRKSHPGDSFTFTAHYDAPGEAAVQMIVVPPGDPGLRDLFHDREMHTEKL